MERVPDRTVLTLGPTATQQLNQLFRSAGKDVADITIRAGYTGRARAFTLGDTVVISAASWNGLNPQQQLGLLAHEITHSVQYDAIGFAAIPRFLVRYAPEYHGNSDNYRLPRALANSPIKDVSVLDKNYTLDQIAQRFRYEIDPHAVGVIP